LDLLWRSVGKIAIGAGVGAATAALPGVAIGDTGSLIATSTAAGGIGAVGELLDQAINVHTGYREAMSLSDVGYTFSTSTVSFGATGKVFSNLRYNSIKNMGTSQRSLLDNYIDIVSRYGYQGEYSEKDGEPPTWLMRSIK